MDRMNAEGIPRDQLLFALKDRRYVASACKIDSCLLCRRNRVNEAGLCQVCWTMLSDEEMAQGTRWLVGVGP